MTQSSQEHQFDIVDGVIRLSEEDLILLGDDGLKIMSGLLNTPSTSKQLSLRFSISRAKIKHLLDWLEECSLVTKKLSNDNLGFDEHLYFPNFKEVTAAHTGSQSENVVKDIAHLIIDSIQHNVLLCSEKKKGITSLSYAQYRIKKEYIASFVQKINELMDEFSDVSERDETAQQESKNLNFIFGIYEELND